MTHPTCNTCKHWGPNGSGSTLPNPEMGACRNATMITDSVSDIRSDGMCIDCGDGDQVLVTGPDFGCVHHDFKDEATRKQWWHEIGDDR